jgi:RNA-directed DNA polymerase
MARVARRVTDKKVLKLIRGYLEAGVMADGVRQPTEQGTPQGFPLSPLLSNVYLDDLDRMLEKSGYRFVHYVDDITIYVRSRRAAERVMQSTYEFIERRLKLRVNQASPRSTRPLRQPFWGSASSSAKVRSRSGSTPRPASGPRIACERSPRAVGASRRSDASAKSTAFTVGGRPTSPLQRALPMPTGVSRAYEGSSIPTDASGMRREPPDADPHVRWCGRGRGI